MRKALAAVMRNLKRFDAMTALGYSRSEAAQAVNAVAAEGHDNRGYFEGGAQAHDYLLRIEDRCFSWKTDEF